MVLTRRVVMLAAVLAIAGTWKPAFASDKEIEKSVSSSTASVGESVVWTLLAKNTSTAGGGPLDTPNAVVTDTLPDGFVVNSATSTQGTCTVSNRTVTCSLGTLAAGAIVTITIESTPVSPGEFTNTATITSGSFDPDSSNNTSSASVTVTAPTADIATSKTVSPSEVTVGATVTFTITVTNNGPDDATAARMQDNLSAIFTNVVASSTKGTCTISANNEIECTIGSLGSGESAVVTVTAVASVPGTYSNTAAADAEQFDSNSTNNSGSASVTVLDDDADISVTKSADRARGRSGQDIVYTVVVTNAGPQDASGVRMVDSLPVGRDGGPGVEFVSVSPSAGCSSASGTITCEIGELAAGDTKTFTITTYITSSSQLENNVTVTSTSPDDPDFSNNFASAETDARTGQTGGSNPEEGDSADPVGVLSGEFFFDEPADLDLGGIAGPSFQRSYASFLTRDDVVARPLGPNWTHNYNWSFSSEGAFAEAISPSGRAFAFRHDGAEWRLLNPAGGAYSLTENSGSFAFADFQAQTVYVFTGSALSEIRTAGFTTQLNWTGSELMSVEGPGGTLTLVYSQGQMISITDGSRTMSFGYQGDLLSEVSHPGGVVLGYEYDAGSIEGLLTRRLMPSGVSRTVQAYDSEGRVSSQADALGNATTFDYSSSGTRVTFADGTTAVYTHDSEGRLSSMTRQDGSRVDITQADGGRSAVDGPDGTTRRTLDPDTGLPVTVVGVGGAGITLSYIDVEIGGALMPLIQSVTYPDGRSTGYTYTSAGQIAGYTDPAGGTFAYEYDADGFLSRATNPLGGSISFEYGASGMSASTDELGNRTTYTRDNAGRVTRVTYPDGSTRETSFDAAGRVTAETDETGITTSYAYDADGNVLSVTDGAGGVTRFSWDPAGRMTGLTDPMGATTSVRYNVMGDPVEITDRDGAVHSYSYDALGRLTAADRPDGSTFAFSRDGSGRVTGLSGASQSASQNLDANGNVTSVTSATGRATTFTLNELGQRVAITDPKGGTTTLERAASGGITGVTLPDGSGATYDLNDWGQVVGVTDGVGGRWTRSYDVSGRATGWASPGGSEWSLEYDTRGNLSAVVSPSGRIDRDHDAAGRLTGERYPDGTTRTLSYDAAGRLIGTSDVMLGLNARGEVVSSNGFSGDRDESGRLTGQTWPGSQSVQYEYDSGGQLVSVSDWVGGQVRFEYDETGALATIERPNGVQTAFARDADGFITRVQDLLGNETLAGVTVTRDPLGNTVSAERMLPVLLDRTPFEFDTSLDADGRMDGFTYDASGRQTSSSSQDLSFDGRGHLTAVDSQSAQYDGFGNLTAFGSLAVEVSYLTDVPTPATLTESGEVWHYVHTPAGRPLYRVADADSARQFFHFDEMGNATIITDDSGAILGGWAFDAYGRIIGRSGSTGSPFLFAGMHGAFALGESGLYRMGVRVYDSGTGRFVTPEPHWDRVDPKTLDPYGYAAQNPLRFVDASGRSPKDAASTDPATSGSSVDFLGGLSSTFSAAGFWSAGVADGFGNSGVTGFLDDIRGTTPNGGLHRALRGDVVDAARDVSRLAEAGDARGAANAATKARVLANEAKELKNAGRAANAAGNVATVAGVALAAYEAKGRFDRVDSDFDRALQSASRTFDNQVENLMRALKRGTITREEFRRRFKAAQDLHKARIDNEQWRHTLDLGIEGTRFLIKGLESLVPIPVISIGDIGMKAGGWLFGTGVPK